MIIGGGQVYDLFFDKADRVYLTQVDTTIDGDTYFPELDPGDWTLSSTESHTADDRHPFGYEFRVYDRL